jgi:hypothetical protein
MQEKTCFKCFVKKPLDQYYRHKWMADGHLNKCKECTKRDSTKHRWDNLEYVQAYDRKRGLTEEHKAKNREVRAKLLSTEAGRKKYNESCRASTRKHYNKRLARIAVSHAMKSGALIRQPCERCGVTKRIHAHHEDYSKPLDVNWLCKDCHGKRHQEINEERRNAAK